MTFFYNPKLQGSRLMLGLRLSNILHLAALVVRPLQGLSDYFETRTAMVTLRRFMFALACFIGGVTTVSTTTAQAQAATASATIAVTATVLSFCTITALPLVFGNYSSVVDNVNTTVSLTCTATTPYNVGLSLGDGTGTSIALREMTYLTNTLGYQLYSDTNHTVVWGPTIGTNTVAGTATGLLTNLTVYGQIPAGEFATPGAYLDTVTATITY